MDPSIRPDRRRSLALAAAILFAPGLVAAQTASVTIEKPWVRYLLPNIPAAAYMTLQNNGATDATLTAAASPACGMLMLHKSQDDSGMAMMSDVANIIIPAHQAITLAPGGYHLMCMAPRMKPGDKITLTLTFQNGATLKTHALVYGAQSGP